MIRTIIAWAATAVRLPLLALIFVVRLYFITLWKLLRYVLPRFVFSGQESLQADLVLVTGAGNGLGRQIAFKFAEMGATLVLWDSDEEAVRAVAEEAESFGTQAHYFACDCTNKDDVHRIAKKVQQEVGYVSVIINNLNICTGRRVVELDEERLENVMKTNFFSKHWITKAFLPWMVHNDYGYIVNLITQPLFVETAGNADHAASEAAVFAFSEAFRSELRLSNKRGVQVTCVCLWKKEYKPTELPNVAEQIIEAMLSKRSLITIPRHKYLFVALKCVLPDFVFDEVTRFVGTC